MKMQLTRPIRSGAASTPKNVQTKQRIIYLAAELFADKGYTETTMRELGAALGLKSASIYYHFPSKSAILEHMLDEYYLRSVENFRNRDVLEELRRDPTIDGILRCMQIGFSGSEEAAAHDIKVMGVVLQEQHRNPIMRKFVTEQLIMNAEKSIIKIFDALKTLNIIRQDMDPDFWVKTSSSLFYAFANRYMLGNGDNAKDYSGLDMAGLLRELFNRMLEENKV